MRTALTIGVIWSHHIITCRACGVAEGTWDCRRTDRRFESCLVQLVTVDDILNRSKMSFSRIRSDDRQLVQQALYPLSYERRGTNKYQTLFQMNCIQECALHLLLIAGCLALLRQGMKRLGRRRRPSLPPWRAKAREE